MDKDRTFAGIEEQYASFKNAAILLQPIPYDNTSTGGKGANNGFEAFLEAADVMELYDIETDSEVYKKGIHLLPPIHKKTATKAMYELIKQKVAELLNLDKYLTFLGGEHSISIGIIDAYKQKYPDLTVLHLDAHADLRERHVGSRYNPACSMHVASKSTNLIQVGIRSMDKSEEVFLNKENCYFAHDIHAKNSWIDSSIKKMTHDVYLSLDLDVFDPGIMPSTGSPEPGGLDWYTTLNYLRKVFMLKNVVGFDIVEFAPLSNFKSPDFLVAKLYYKLLSYKFLNRK